MGYTRPGYGVKAFYLVVFCIAGLGTAAISANLDVAPFGKPLAEGLGIYWEDPREIHRVVLHFEGTAPRPNQVKLEYWGSRWPEQHLPKHQQPGGGSVGWMELGNWYNGGWRVADAEGHTDGNTLSFSFRPVNKTEFPNLTDYSAPFRYTLKIRVISAEPLPRVERIETFTDSAVQPAEMRLVFCNSASGVTAEAFNGKVDKVEKESGKLYRIVAQIASNSDPNTFDRTLITVRAKKQTFTFAPDDLSKGPLLMPQYGIAVLPAADTRDYSAVLEAQRTSNRKNLYDWVGEVPEQTWKFAWDNMPRKKSAIVFPLGLDGGRQRFRLESDGQVVFRTTDNDRMNRSCPGKDTPRLDLEKPAVRLSFGLPKTHVYRTIQEASLPICYTTWELDGVRAEQSAFVTALEGTQGDGATPAPDTFAVFMARFTFTNSTDAPKQIKLPLNYKPDGSDPVQFRFDQAGFFWAGKYLRGQMLTQESPASAAWEATLPSHQVRTVVLKLPYVLLNGPSEQTALAKLNFDTEREAVARYWRRRLSQSAELISPEPMLNEFYRAHAGHLLINCEGQPGKNIRFARVGSFHYGAYGNESCMMVSELERRGYHREAQECLDAWLRYQGTVGLPGDFSTNKGVLYGAAGYEMGGYNQHHGWILWSLAEHYRYTRDRAWLGRSTQGIIDGANWIINETARTKSRTDLSRGLLPAGSLEDIGDWWTWLSTSCYSWRGLDAAAWALEQIHHPEAQRIRKEANDYRQALLTNFRMASERSPVVRLRDGTAVAHIPSYAERRGRSFGWICETLEGSLHLLISRAMDPKTPEAEWILKDYEDNRYISNQYGYLLEDFDQQWFDRGGMSMQACLLFSPEPYLYRDDVKQALRAAFNAIAVSYFPDVRMNTEHALPQMDQWAGDHYKTSDEANAAGWLRKFFIREENEDLIIGQCVPREWLQAGQKCGLSRSGTWFGKTSILYRGNNNEITAYLDGPRRNPPQTIRVRFREPNARPIQTVRVNGRKWNKFSGEWVYLPGDIGRVTVTASF